MNMIFIVYLEGRFFVLFWFYFYKISNFQFYQYLVISHYLKTFIAWFFESFIAPSILGKETLLYFAVIGIFNSS